MTNLLCKTLQTETSFYSLVLKKSAFYPETSVKTFWRDVMFFFVFTIRKEKIFRTRKIKPARPFRAALPYSYLGFEVLTSVKEFFGAMCSVSIPSHTKPKRPKIVHRPILYFKKKPSKKAWKNHFWKMELWNLKISMVFDHFSFYGDKISMCLSWIIF